MPPKASHRKNAKKGTTATATATANNNNNNNNNNKTAAENQTQQLTKSFAGLSLSSALATSTKLPLWLTEGSTQRDKNVLCESVTLHTPGAVKKELIKNARVQFVAGRRYGFIGKNGSGKTTLLNAVSSYALPNFPKYLRVVHVQQHDMPLSQSNVMDYVIKSDIERMYLEEERTRLEKLLDPLGDDELPSDSEQNDENSEAVPAAADADTEADIDPEVIQDALNRVEERLSEIDARRAATRAKAILKGLGFSDERQQAKIASLSGGWRQRVALACALFVVPDILLLDEPTNHLDFPSVRWLEEYLRNFEQTLVIVSHDREFLDNVITDVMELRNQELQYYRGDYKAYCIVHEQHLNQQRHDYEVQQKKISELKQFIEEAKKSDNPATVNLGRSRQKQLEKMELIEPVIDEKEFRFRFPVPGKLDHDIVQIQDMAFTYHPDQKPRKMLLHDVDLNVDMGSRIGMLGINGAGKSTLIKLILGELKPTEGICRFNHHARAALFTQHHIDQLDLTVSAMAYFQRSYPEAKEDKIRGVLGRFGFDDRLANQKMQTLSGGQRSRVAFAVLTWKEPHLIMMDEPTNHLDIETIESLIEAISHFEGAVLLVSHDQYFLTKVATSFWAVDEDGDVDIFYDLDEAKEFSYNIVDPTLVKRKDLIKAEKEAEIAEKQKNKSAANAGAGTDTSRAGGKKKRKTKKGAGGIPMAELKVDELVDEIENQKVDKQIVDVVIESPPHSDDEGAANEEEEEEEQEAEDMEEETQPVETVDTKPKPKKQKSAPKAKVPLQHIPVNAFALLDLEEDNAPESDEEDRKKLKKKKKKRVSGSEEEGDEVRIREEKKKSKAKKILSDEEEQFTGKNKKKKRVMEDEPADEEADGKKKKKKVVEDVPAEDDEAGGKKKKKKKKEAAEDADNAEEADVSVEKQKKKKKVVEDEPADDEEADGKKKKKKKVVEDVPAEDDEAGGKKKKKKKKEEEEKDIVSAEEADVSADKKKKKKKVADEVPVEDDEAGGKKKKKKKKEEEDMDNAEEVDASMEKKKKKKKVVEEAPADDEEADGKKKKKKKAVEDVPAEDDEASGKKKKKKKKEEAEDVDNAEEADPSVEKKKKKKQVTEVPVEDDEAGGKKKKKKKTQEED